MFNISYRVDQNILIDKPANQVFASVADFREWTHWSPWLAMEPHAQIEIKNSPLLAGHFFAWRGELIGSGSMELVGIEPEKEIKIRLRFLLPFRSESLVSFRFEAKGNRTQVYWEMLGHLPWFMFFFKKTMTAYVENDFRRGLLMLKEYLETGHVLSKSELVGTGPRKGFYYIGVHHDIKISDIAQVSKQDFTELGNYVRKGEFPAPAFMFTLYRRFDMVTGDCEMTSAFAYQTEVEAENAFTAFENDPDAKISGLQSNFVDEHKGLEVLHTGSYHHLGNAWATAMAAQRALKLKRNKAVEMYELYQNTPVTAAAGDLKTQLIIPVK